MASSNKKEGVKERGHVFDERESAEKKRGTETKQKNSFRITLGVLVDVAVEGHLAKRQYTREANRGENGNESKNDEGEKARDIVREREKESERNRS